MIRKAAPVPAHGSSAVETGANCKQWRMRFASTSGSGKYDSLRIAALLGKMEDLRVNAWTHKLAAAGLWMILSDMDELIFDEFAERLYRITPLVRFLITDDLLGGVSDNMLDLCARQQAAASNVFGHRAGPFLRVSAPQPFHRCAFESRPCSCFQANDTPQVRRLQRFQFFRLHGRTVITARLWRHRQAFRLDLSGASKAIPSPLGQRIPVFVMLVFHFAVAGVGEALLIPWPGVVPYDLLDLSASCPILDGGKPRLQGTCVAGPPSTFGYSF
jgi:hypothetical protein